MAHTGPPLKPYSSLSPAGKSQRKNPTKHRAWNRKNNKKESEKKDRAEHNRERRKRGIYGKMKPGGKVLGRQRNGSLAIRSQRSNAAANGSGGNSRYA